MLLGNILVIATTLLSTQVSGAATDKPPESNRTEPALGTDYEWQISQWSAFCDPTAGGGPNHVCRYDFHVSGDEIAGDPQIPKFTAHCAVLWITIGSPLNMPCDLLDMESYPGAIGRNINAFFLAGREGEGEDVRLWISYEFRELSNQQQVVYNYSTAWGVVLDGMDKFRVPTLTYTRVNV